MAFDANNLVLHIRRLVRCSIRLGYHSARDHPEVLGAAIVLLFLHALCPTLFDFVLSSSPVICLTALLLGALLSYGEATVPFGGEETLKDHDSLSLKSNIHVSDCSNKESEDFSVKAQLEKRSDTDSNEVHVGERACDDCMQDALCEDKNVTYIASDAAVLSEAYVDEETTPNDSLHGTHCEEKNVTFVTHDTVLSAEPSNHPEINATLECEDCAKEIGEKEKLQEPESACTGSCNNGVHYQYQFGEFMRSCWQPVIRQEIPYCESDLSDESSSPDASMTDIIPMLEDLHPLINLGSGEHSLSSRDKLDSSSDDNEYDLEEEEEESVSSDDDDEGAERQENNDVNWNDAVHLNCLDMEQNVKLEGLMELQRAKNMLKFELDMRSIDLQAADATQKLKDASSFHVQVPSISTPRHNPFDPPRDSEDSIELPHIPGSAPSVLHPRRNLFDIPFDRAVHHRSRFQESWTPRSRFRSAQNMKHRNSYGQNHSAYLQYHNGEVGDRHSDGDAEQEGNNGKLFGSLKAHLGEEMKILSAAISDVGVLGEVNHGTDEANGNANVRDDGSSLPRINNSEPHFVEADSMSEINSMFKCRMEEVLVQSISERSVCQPLEVKPQDIPSVPLSSDSWMHANKASSVGELNVQLVRDEEALSCASSGLNGHSESIQDRSSEASCVVDKQSSEPLIELDVYGELSTAGDHQTEGMSEPNEPLTIHDKLPILEVSSVDEMNSLFEQLEQEPHLSNGRSKMDIRQGGLCEVDVDLVELNSRARVIGAVTLDDASDSGSKVTEL